MISAIVLVSDRQSTDDLEHAHEVAVRSLVWLVSAVVSSTVRDVMLATPPGFGLSEVADQAGCALVQAEEESGRLAAAIAAARGPRLLILRAGYNLDARICDELDAFIRRRPEDTPAVILSEPQTAAQRLLPGRAPVVGVLASKAACAALAPRSFSRLVREMRGATRLKIRAERII
jgi:hypothetical protein